LLEDFFSLFAHRLEEHIAEKDSLLEVERQEHKTTNEDVTNARKKISELIHELQQSEETRKQLEDTIKRSDAFSSEDTCLNLFINIIITL
jgi:myosin V